MFLGASEPSSVSYLFSKFKSLWFPLRKVYFTQVGGLNMTFYRQKNNSMSAEAKKVLLILQVYGKKLMFPL